MPIPRVEIDLNDTDADGKTLVFLSDASAPLEVGRMVTAFESEDGVCAPALVASVDSARGIAFIWVDWTSLAQEHREPDMTRLAMRNRTAISAVVRREYSTPRYAKATRSSSV